MSPHRVLLALTLSLTLTPGALPRARADWPQFRGPHGNGIARDTNGPAVVDAGSIAWSASLPGRGLSSPIVVGDRVFVTCASGPKQDRLHVICFNAKDGRKVWERQFWATGRTMTHDKTCVAAPSPASDGERIFALFSSNDLLCLDLEGNLLWLRGLTRDYPNASNSLGMSSSLTTADGVVIAMIENDSESFTAGLEAATGVNRWKLDRPKSANWTSPLLLASPGEPTLALLQSSKGLAAVEARTGRMRWQYTDSASTIPTATVSEGVVFVPSQGLTAFAPAPAEGQTPKQLWRTGQLRPGTASPVVLRGRVYTLNEAGVMSCGDAANGTRLWQLRLKGPFSATPVAAGTTLYCVNEKGLLQVVDTTAPEGRLAGEWNLGQTVLSTPALARGGLYVRSDATLWRIGKP